MLLTPQTGVPKEGQQFRLEEAGLVAERIVRGVCAFREEAPAVFTLALQTSVSNNTVPVLAVFQLEQPERKLAINLPESCYPL